MRPDLSVAIIFKNEIRCLERCLKSLQPLKERIPCEIVMADTGSDDGSRAIAEQYADIVFDFPWINDFSAARNAVLERCTGAWVLSIDCDEWLDDNFEELVSFLNNRESDQYGLAQIIIRNYISTDFCQYRDFPTARLIRRATQPHYAGAIHEMLVLAPGTDRMKTLRETILHHDGYLMFSDGSEEGKAKRARNLSLINKELEKSPDDLRRLLQYLESADDDDEYLSHLRHAVAVIVKKQDDWRNYGAAIMRYAIAYAERKKLPELEDWAGRAKNIFPKSYYIRIDATFDRFTYAYDRADFDKTIVYGEEYLKARADFARDPGAYDETSASALKSNSVYWEQYARLCLAEAYCKRKQAQRGFELLKQLTWTQLDANRTSFFVSLLKIMAREGIDVAPLLNACWNGIQQPVPSAERAAERVAAFNEQVHVEDADSEPESEPKPEPEPKTDSANAELLQLAAKVKIILAKFPPDDPAIVDLKNSPAYQKVAWLIEDGTV